MTDRIQQAVVGGGEKLAARFWPKVQKGSSDECWPWTAALKAKGYGSFTYNGKGRTTFAHRVAYILTNGPIPDGLQIDHLCRNRVCCNPRHLEAVTPQENMLRGEPASRTHCPRGHAYTEENTYRRGGKRRNQRECRTCRRDVQSQHRTAVVE